MRQKDDAAGVFIGISQTRISPTDELNGNAAPLTLPPSSQGSDYMLLVDLMAQQLCLRRAH